MALLGTWGARARLLACSGCAATAGVNMHTEWKSCYSPGSHVWSRSDFFPEVFSSPVEFFPAVPVFVVLVELMASAMQASALADHTELSEVPCLGAVAG